MDRSLSNHFPELKERSSLHFTSKLMPTAGEKLIWSQGTSRDITLTTTPLPSHPTPVKISATICWENYMPLLRTHLYTQGVQVYCAPTVDGREQWGSTMRHVALEGRCFVLSANQMSP
jgi:nitrilase